MNTEYQKFESDYCSCDQCSSICKFSPGILIPGDIERIAAHVNEICDDGSVNPQFMQEVFTVSFGVYHPRNDSFGNQELSANRNNGKRHMLPPIITPDVLGETGCIFYDGEAGKCSIHTVAPFGCKRLSLCNEDDSHAEKIQFICDQVSEDELYHKQWRVIAKGKTAEEVELVKNYEEKMEDFYKKTI